MVSEIVNYLFGGGGLIALITLFLDRRKRKLEVKDKEVQVNSDATKSIQEAYQRFVNDSKNKTEELMKDLAELEKKVEGLTLLNNKLEKKYNNLKEDYDKLVIEYENLKNSITKTNTNV